MVNKLSLYDLLLNTRLRKEADMGDHVRQMESQFSRLAATGSNIEESKHVAIFISYFADLKEYTPTIASINIMPENGVTWNYVSMIFIEE